MKTKQKGFTIVELLVTVVVGAGVVVVIGGLIFVAFHFIAKVL